MPTPILTDDIDWGAVTRSEAHDALLFSWVEPQR